VKFIVTKEALLKNLQQIEGVVSHNPVLSALESFLFELSKGPVRSKLAIDRTLASLKEWRHSKISKFVRRVIRNTKRLKHLRNFFSFSSCINIFTVHRRFLLQLIKRSPEEDGAFELLVNSNSFYSRQKMVYDTKNFRYHR